MPFNSLCITYVLLIRFAYFSGYLWYTGIDYITIVFKTRMVMFCDYKCHTVQDDGKVNLVEKKSISASGHSRSMSQDINENSSV